MRSCSAGCKLARPELVKGIQDTHYRLGYVLESSRLLVYVTYCV